MQSFPRLFLPFIITLLAYNISKTQDHLIVLDWNTHDIDAKIRTIVPTQNEGVITAGNFEYETGSRDPMFLVSLDVTGNELWSKSWTGSGQVRPYRIFRSVQCDRYLITGYLIFGNQKGRIFISEMNGKGNPVWSYSLGLD